MTTTSIFKIKSPLISKLIPRVHYAGLRLIGYPIAWTTRRLALNTTFIGVTGSAGKTTTKDVCAAMLSEFGPCAVTPESKNQHLYIVKNLRTFSWFQRYSVIEMSGARPGELDHFMSLAKPDIGVLTNIGRDHYKAFKGIEGLIEEKAKIVGQLSQKGVAVLNIDDSNVRAIGDAWPHRKIWVGRSKDATIRLIDASSKWPEPLILIIEHDKTTYEVRTGLYGEHMALPILCALGVAVALDLPLVKAIEGVNKVTAPEGRMQIVKGDDGVIFIRDDWKAPDWTLQAPIEFLSQADAGRKVAIIGTVSDFSTDSSSKYKQIAKRVMEAADLVVFIGPNAHRAVRARKEPEDESLLGFERIVDAARFLKRELRSGDLVLLKGSAKADHLVRLVYDRYQPIECWEERCGLNRFCGNCPQLYQPRPQSAKTLQDSIDRLAASETLWGDPKGMATVVVGLGNPGAIYEDTRHNIGYKAVDMLAKRIGSSWQQCNDGLMCRGVVEGGKSVILFKPAAKMNASGALVRRFLLDHNGHPKNCIIVHDEMDLKVGDVRLKFDGSSTGHHGVQSVLSALGTQAVTRLRVGARSVEDNMAAKQAVLASFPVEDQKRIETAVKKATDLLLETMRGIDSSLDAIRYSS